jgi:hypothetical protein
MVLHQSPNEHSTDGQPRCEFGTTPLGEECQESGDFRYGDLLLCEHHAQLLQLEDRAEAVLGTVFRMDEWLEEKGDSSSDEEFVGRVRREREEAVAALRLIRAQIRDARKALSAGR